MLGKRDPQGSLFAASTMIPDKDIEEMGVYGHLAREGYRVFKDEDFAGLYCSDNGRPSVPPSVLALATLLQFHARTSDAETVQRCRYDLRWKAALRLELHDTKAPFVKGTLQGFRARLSLHDAEGELFERSVEVARDAGLLPKKLLIALDSSPVRGRGAIKDTYNLLSDAIRKVLERVAAEQGQGVHEMARGAGLARHVEATSIKGSVEIDWQNVEEKRRFLADLLADCAAVLEMAKEVECEGEETRLLEQVIRQDVVRGGESGESEDADRPDPSTDGGGDGEDEGKGEDELPDIRRGVAKDRIASASDPQMRHGRKSSGATYNGHKAHVAVAESGVVTDVDVTAPSEPEGSKVAEAIERTRKVTGREVNEALGDCAYGTETAARQAREVEIQMRSKMPAPPKGRFGPGDFDVSEDRLQARCPAGHESSTRQRSSDDHLHIWNEELCGNCPLVARCTTSQIPRRTLRVRPDFHDRRARERWARSPEGRSRLRVRVVVEHAIGRLKRLGAGRARYFGRSKTRFQWLMTAAVANLSLAWSAAEPAPAA